jgi:CDP-glycerol glycerophosphotransferase (TagB/SpsB family)
MLVDFLCFLLRIVNSLVPKNRRKFIFTSVPDYSGNVKAFFEYLNEKTSDYKFVWLVEKIDSAYEHKGSFCVKRSIRGLYHFFTSRYIITNHSVFASLKCSAQFLIDFWHGMPVKKVGLFDKREDNRVFKRAYVRSKAVDFTIATSELYRAILSASFQIDPRKIFVTGQPRNDRLFNTNRLDIQKLFVKDGEKQFEHIIMYAPTFRKNSGKGKSEYRNNIFNFSDYDEELLLSELKDKNILLLFKPHPFEEYKFGLSCRNAENVRLITERFLHEKKLDLHRILGGVDLLITDFSSLYFDFLLLDRPIVFAIPDMQKYSGERGLFLEPLDFWLPGPVTVTFLNLMDEIVSNLEAPERFSQRRDEVNELVNKYKDSKSCERSWVLIRRMLKKS